MIQTVYFNTGVRPARQGDLPWQTPITPYGCQVVRGGVIEIPMEVEDLPKGATFLYAQDHLDPEKLPANVIYRKILNPKEPGGMISKYAFFRIEEQPR